MTAGMNIQIKLWRMANSDDDTVGGAQITGSAVGLYPARLQSHPTEQLLLQQGLETVRTFTCTVVPGTTTFYERDEIEVTRPKDHIYYGDRFRIIGVRYADHNPRDPRNYAILDVARNVRAHAEQ